MSRKYFLLLFILFSACNPITPTSPPTPSAPPDEFAVYRTALTTAAQNDPASLDRPTRYNLTLQYDPATTTLAGSEEVVYFNRQSTALNEIYFRLFANYPKSGGKIGVTQATVDGATVTPSLQVQDTALRVPLAKPLEPNGSVKLHLDFSVTIPRVSGQHYDDMLVGNFVTTMPSIYPLIPQYDEKGWHIDLPPAFGDLVYADVALFTMSLTVPTKTTVIASGSTVATRDNGDGTVTWKIVGAPMRDFNLNLTTQLQIATGVIGDTTINSYYESTDTDSGKRALEIATNAFKFFQEHFGAYPYRELDVVETPTTAGGIEYPGVVVIARRLYNNRERDYFEFVIAHEVAHQWWYGIVGNDQVNYPWLDEALAQFSTLMYFENRYGKNTGTDILRNVFQNPYQRVKSEGRDAVVNQPVSAFNDSDYSAIVYGKGPLFFDAIRKKMGDDKFNQFLKTYYERYRYKIVFPDNLVKSAEEVCVCSVQAEYQQWILSAEK